MSDLAARLREACNQVRVKSYPLSDLIPLMQQAANALEAAQDAADTSAEYANGYAEGFNDACADTRVGELQRENAALRGQCQVIAWRVDHQSVLGHGAIRGDWRDGCPSEAEVLELKECLPSSVIYFAYGLAGTAPSPSKEYVELPKPPHWGAMHTGRGGKVEMYPQQYREALDRAFTVGVTCALRTGGKP